MLEHAIYSVVTPEGCASILWKDAGLAAEAMKILAEDMLGFGIVDAVVPEPPGGAHTDPSAAAGSLGIALRETLGELDRSYGIRETLDAERLLQDRFARYRNVGAFQEG